MSMMMRQIITSVLYSLFLLLLIAGIIFSTFPLSDWSQLLDKKVLEVPFIIVVISIAVIGAIIFGIATYLYWRQYFRQLDRQLENLLTDQKLQNEEPIKELASLQYHLHELQQKIREQTEYAQRLATERAESREKSLQEIVVQERNRLARELHDSVSQQLFAVSMMMSAINETNPPKEAVIKKQLQLVENMVHQSQLEMRALLLHLRPVALKGKTLQEGMKELLLELTQKVPMEIEWKIEDFSMDKGIEDQLFRILQESVSNTLRHAKASLLHVMLIERDEKIILRVVDNGIGFDIEKVKTGSYGMQNMRERAYEVGGNLKIISLPNEGTRLEVKVPKLEKEGVNDD